MNATSKSIIPEYEFDDRARREPLGQFLTPVPIADLMASFFGEFPSTLRLLDAGAGAGALTAAVVRRLCREGLGVRRVEATAWEIDPSIIPHLRAMMHECGRECERHGIEFVSVIHEGDFVHEEAGRTHCGLFDSPSSSFDAAIVNPPYRKIRSDSSERRVLGQAGIETSNLYSGFVWLITRLLRPEGQLVGITPRSFCNGPYFKPFRRDFLHCMQLRRLHVFESRKAVFRKDSVLQENVIFHVVKSHAPTDAVIISSSGGEPGDAITQTAVPFDEVVFRHDPDQFIHIPSADLRHSANLISTRPMTDLGSLGLSVSTGRVVDFRNKEALRSEPAPGTVPLLYPCHIQEGSVSWPKFDSRKANALLVTEKTRPWLVPNGPYVLTKRFTAKEERRRIVACFYNPIVSSEEWLGIENHLNYFHADGRGLDRRTALGLFAYLNSTAVDRYFRRFSGHTQVNASDLRKLPYPNRAVLRAIAAEIRDTQLTQAQIDAIVSRHLPVDDE